MGWTYTKRPPAITPAEFLKERCWGSQREKLIGTATVGKVVYFALKTKAAPWAEKMYQVAPDGTITVALVYLIDTKTGPDGYNFGWKDMDETVGPYDEGRCPASIMRLLSPFKPEYTGYAKQWRERQKAYKPGQLAMAV